MSEDVRPCLLPHCARHAAGQLLLCWPDRDRLARLLDPGNVGGPDPARPELGHQPGGLVALYRDAATIGGPTGTERAGEHADHARVDDRLIAIRDVRTTWAGAREPRAVLPALGGWARIVHEELGDALPSIARRAWVIEPTRWGRIRRGDVVYELRPVPTTWPELLPDWTEVPVRLGRQLDRPDVQAVTTLCRWLHARIDWICAQPWVDELATDLRDVTAQLRAGHGGGGRRLGPCPATVDPDTGELDPLSPTLCGAELYSPGSGPRDPGPLDVPTVRCDTCGARFFGTELLRLARERGLVDEFAEAAVCPVHDLAPDRQVRTRVAGTLLEGSAAEVCAAWHRDYERAG